MEQRPARPQRAFDDRPSTDPLSVAFRTLTYQANHPRLQHNRREGYRAAALLTHDGQAVLRLPDHVEALRLDLLYDEGLARWAAGGEG